MSGARQAPRETDSFGRPLPAEAIRVSDLMPARDKSVILFIADADVAIHGLPVVGWNSGTNDESIWWTGVPGNYIALSEHRWSVTHWAPLQLRQEPAVNAELLADELDEYADRITKYTNNTGDGLCSAAATELRALSDRNAELLEALNNQMAATYALLEWAVEVSDEYLDGETGLRAELANDLSKAREHSNQSRAAISKAGGAA